MTSESTFVSDVVSDSSAKKFKTTSVHKDVDPKLDLGNLLIEDIEPVTFESGVNVETELLNRNRDNVQFLVNNLWVLPTQTVDHIVVAKLPQPTTRLPREKPLPQPKAETKWEKFAKIKGIAAKSKRSRMIWDEVSQTYKPRWGYGRADDTNDWLIEVPEQKDPYKDYFSERKTAKKERTAKNELQRMRNIARAQKVDKEQPQGIGLNQGDQNAQQISRQIVQAKTSTASFGKFDPAVKGEKQPKDSGKKRKFQPNEASSGPTEKIRQLDILEKMSRKKPKIDEHKAIRMHEDNEEAEEAKKPRAGKRGTKKIRKKTPRTTPKKLKKMVQGRKARINNRKNNATA